MPEKAPSPKLAQGLTDRVKREAWQRTGRSVSRDKGYNPAGHDSAPLKMRT